MYEIRAAGPAKGLGVFAKALIPIGTRIFSESPILYRSPVHPPTALYSLVQKLSEADHTYLLSPTAHTTPQLTFLRWNLVLYQSLKSLFISAPIPSQNPSKHAQSPSQDLNLRGKPSLSQQVRIMSIFRSNTFLIFPTRSEPSIVLFSHISRLNHSCIPNARMYQTPATLSLIAWGAEEPHELKDQGNQVLVSSIEGNWSTNLSKFNVHATRDIASGEEVTLDYLCQITAIRDRRVAQLKESYGFVCSCPACNLTTSTWKAGEAAREKVNDLLAEFTSHSSELGRKDEELDVIMQLLSLYEDAGITGREVASMYLGAAKINEGMDRVVEALRCSEVAEGIDRACLGVDHEVYAETRERVERLRALL